MGKLVVFGDSLSSTTYVADADTYGRRLATELGFAQYVNSSIAGYYAAGLLPNINANILTHDPDEVIIMLGTNDAAADAASGKSVDLTVSDYVTGMGGAMDVLAANGIPATFFSAPPSRNVFEFERLRLMAEALRRLCLKKGVGFVDVFAEFVNKMVTASAFNALYMADPDKYHIVPAGHDVIYNAALRTRLGFGAGLPDVPPPPPPPPSGDGTVYQQTLNQSFGNVHTRTVRTVLVPTVVPNAAVTSMRLTLKASGDESLSISALYVGQRTTDLSASSLSQVKVGGQASFVIPLGQEVVTDWFSVTWNGTTPLVVSFYCEGGPSSDRLPAHYPHSGSITAIKDGNEASALSPTGFSSYAEYASLVSKIETDGFQT